MKPNRSIRIRRLLLTIAASLLVTAPVGGCAPERTEGPAPSEQQAASGAAAAPQPAPGTVLGPQTRNKEDEALLARLNKQRQAQLARYPAQAPGSEWRAVLRPFLANAEPLYSQWNEELVIRDFFQDRTNGVFVDVGCYLPIEISTTYYLEHHLNWSGIAIDANAILRTAWEKTRPRSRFFQYATTDKDGETITFYLKGGVSAIDKKTAESFGGESAPITVPTITLNTLLDTAGITKIDLLSMDINGAEMFALKGFDIRRFQPELVLVEPQEDLEQLAEYFAKNGYERIEKYSEVDKLNWYFRPAAQAK